MKYKVTLNGKTYEVEVERGEAMIAAEYAAAAPAAPAKTQDASSQKVAQPVSQTSVSASPNIGETVYAPIPGIVLKIIASEGKQVKKGEVILVLEAMKMENEILAPDNGTLTAILVSKGVTVQSNDALFTIS